MNLSMNVTRLTEVDIQILEPKRNELYLAQGPRFKVTIGYPEAHITLRFEDYWRFSSFVENLRSHLDYAGKSYNEWAQERMDMDFSD